MQERKYHAYTLHNYKQIPQIQALTKDQLEAIEVVERIAIQIEQLCSGRTDRLEQYSR